MDRTLPSMDLLRKFIHLSICVFGFSLYYFDKKYCLPLFLVIGISFIALDLIRIKNDKVNKFFYKFFGFVSRDYEKKRLTGASYAFLAIMITSTLFNVKIASASIVILSISDVLASYVGIKIGKFKVLNKTLEGSLAFFISTAIILICFGFSSIQIIIVSLGCTVMELLSDKVNVDDNLSVPIIGAVLLRLL